MYTFYVLCIRFKIFKLKYYYMSINMSINKINRFIFGIVPDMYSPLIM